MRRLLFTTALAAGMLVVPAAAQAAIINVPAQQPTVQAAVNAANPTGDTINVADGIYAENVTVNKDVTISGASEAGTIIEAPTTVGTSQPAITIANAGSGSEFNNLTIKAAEDLSSAGAQAVKAADTGATDNILFEDVTITRRETGAGADPRSNSYMGRGIWLPGGATNSGWTLDDVTMEKQNMGVYVESDSQDLAISDSDFHGNNFGVMAEGITVDAGANPDVAADGLEITNTDFRGDNAGGNPNGMYKAIYLEAVNDALIEDVNVTDVDKPNPNPSLNNNTGIDLNVKFGSYSDVLIKDVSVSDVARINTGAAPLNKINGPGIDLKGRNDGGTYSPEPATLSNVTVEGATLSGNQMGIEFGNNVVNGKINKSRIVGNSSAGLYSYVDNNRSVDATNNWWGCNAGPTVQNAAGLPAPTGGSGCDSAVNEKQSTGAGLTVNPRLMLSASNPSTTPGGTATVTGSLRVNSAGTDVGPLLFPGANAEFAVTGAGSITPAAASISNGQASSTYTAPNAEGSNGYSVEVDNQTANGTVTVANPPPVDNGGNGGDGGDGGNGGDGGGDTPLPGPGPVDPNIPTDTADDVVGTDTDDVIDGLGGDDSILGGLGDDILNGGDGNDSLVGGKGDDKVSGGSGKDEIDGGKGDDVIRGGDGNDVLDGGDGNDDVGGGKGKDTITANDGEKDEVNCGSGNDTVNADGKDKVDSNCEKVK